MTAERGRNILVGPQGLCGKPAIVYPHDTMSTSRAQGTPVKMLRSFSENPLSHTENNPFFVGDCLYKFTKGGLANIILHSTEEETVTPFHFL